MKRPEEYNFTHIWHAVSLAQIFQRQFHLLQLAEFILFPIWHQKLGSTYTNFEMNPSLSKSTSLNTFLMSFSAMGCPLTGLNLVHPALLTPSIISCNQFTRARTPICNSVFDFLLALTTLTDYRRAWQVYIFNFKTTVSIVSNILKIISNSKFDQLSMSF